MASGRNLDWPIEEKYHDVKCNKISSKELLSLQGIKLTHGMKIGVEQPHCVVNSQNYVRETLTKTFLVSFQRQNLDGCRLLLLSLSFGP